MLDLQALVHLVFGDMYVPINAIPNHFKDVGSCYQTY